MLAETTRCRLAHHSIVQLVPQPALMSDRLALLPLAPEHLDLERQRSTSTPRSCATSVDRRSRMAEVERAHRRRMHMARKVEGLGFWTAFRECGFRW